VDGQCGEVSNTSQVHSRDARRDAEGRSAVRPNTEEGSKEGDRTLPGRTPKTRSPDLFSIDSASAYHTAKMAWTTKKRGTSCCPKELLTEEEMETECTINRPGRRALMFASSEDSEVEEVELPTPRRRRGKGTESNAKASSTQHPREVTRESVKKMQKSETSSLTLAS